MKPAKQLYRVRVRIGTGLIVAVFLFLVLFFVLPAWAAPTAQSTPPAEATPMPPPNHPLAWEGQRVYKETCVSCHGEQGGGDGPAASGLPSKPTAFSDPNVINARTPKELFQVTKDGRMNKGMPPWGVRLDDGSIWQVVAYLFDLGISPDTYNRGREVYQGRCAACHGPTGRGDGPQAPSNIPDLTRWADWIDISNQEWAQKIQGQEVHAKALEGLDKDTLQDVVAYVRTLTYDSTRAPLEGNGVISGTVTMLTPGIEATFQGLTVTLFGLRGGEELALTMSTTVSADNTFHFEGLPTSHEMLYFLQTEWEGVPYTSEPLVFLPGQTVITTTLQVAAVTEEDPGIRAGQAHWFADFDGQTLTVGELISFDNLGKYAYKGPPVPGHEGAHAAIRWELPAGVTQLRVEGGKLGERFLFVDGALIDTVPLPPGRDVRRLLLQYQLPIEHNQAVLAHPVSIPIDLLTVFIADRGEHIQVPEGATEGEPQDVNGVSFKSYTLTRLEKGQTVTFRLTNLAAAAKRANPHQVPPSRVRTAGVVLGALLGIFLIGGMVYLSRRSRQSEEEALEAVRKRSDALLEEIAQLDVAFEQGAIDEASYKEERDLLMAEAVQLTRMIEEAEQAGEKVDTASASQSTGDEESNEAV